MTPQDIGTFNTYMRNWADKNLDGGLNNPTNPALLYGGSLRSFAIVMRSSDEIYHETHHDKTGEDYLKNPMEQHAFKIGNTASYYFGSEKEKKAMINEEVDMYGNMQDLYKNANNYIQLIKQDLNQYRADTTCNTIPAP